MARSRDEALCREWRDRVSRWKASGLSSEMFAQREGIARPRALVAWSHRLRKLERAPLNGEGKAPVRVVQVPGSHGSRARCVASGVRRVH
jgi:hypothetical protein